ncbi:MAG TPA: hypothetical protein VF148_12690 [Acidimicrobiia bacterium]
MSNNARVGVAALTGHRPEPVLLETMFDLRADAVEEHLDISLLERMVG